MLTIMPKPGPGNPGFTCYGPLKNLFDVLQTKPEHVDRVVLIDFPFR